MDSGFMFVYEVWTPKVKWFRPPRIALFRWAYNINVTIFTGLVPTKISLDSKGPTDVDVEFTVSGYNHPEIDKKAEEMPKYDS